MTESFSALEHLRPFMPKQQPFRVIHVGDGAHARTGGMFALKTEGENVSVDPLINEPLVSAWLGATLPVSPDSFERLTSRSMAGSVRTASRAGMGMLHNAPKSMRWRR